MPRLVHLPLALEGAIKVHLISKNSSYYLRNFIHFTKLKLFTRLVHQ